MGKNIEYYLSQDFNIEMAEYFSKGRRTIVSVVADDRALVPNPARPVRYHF